jgi:hypothetical protein
VVTLYADAATTVNVTCPLQGGSVAIPGSRCVAVPAVLLLSPVPRMLYCHAAFFRAVWSFVPLLFLRSLPLRADTNPSSAATRIVTLVVLAATCSSSSFCRCRRCC